MEPGVPWDAPPAPNRTQDLARLLSQGLNVPPSIRNTPNAPIGPGNRDSGAAPDAAFMGIRGSMQPGGPPVADMTFTPTPQNFAPNAAGEARAWADRMQNNDQTFNRTYGAGAQNQTFGEPKIDPFGSMDTERAIQRFAPQQQPTTQQLMQLLATGQGQEA